MSALLLAGIWWWGARRSRQARGNADLRDSRAGTQAGSDLTTPMRAQTGAREWGVPPLEPLSIRTAEFEQVRIVDLPMTAHIDSLEETEPGSVEHEIDAGKRGTMPIDAAEVPTSLPPAPSSPREASSQPVTDGRIPATEAPASTLAPASNLTETQRIVTIRVSARGESRWAGSKLMAALEDHGLAYGRHHVFHRKNGDGRTLFCAASLVEPGTFDLAQMPREQYPGLTLFAVLPGPAEPVQTLDTLIETAGQLAEALHGIVQDSKGLPLSLESFTALREDVARFQASLTMA